MLDAAAALTARAWLVIGVEPGRWNAVVSPVELVGNLSGGPVLLG